jgi:CIC family chloride channel protein
LASIQVAEFRRRFPLGSTNKVVLVDSNDHYSGIVETAKAYEVAMDPTVEIGSLAVLPDTALTPAQDVRSAIRTFDLSEADYLAVLSDDGSVLGTLSERFIQRRYADELEKAQRDMFGE